MNFPQNLDIAPSAHPDLQLTEDFAESAQRQAILQYGIAGRVWEAAYATLLYIRSPPDCAFDPPFLDVTSPRTIIELGSGTGVVAVAIASVVDQHKDLVIATDLPEVCPLLDKNLQTSPGILVRPLAWGDENAGRELASELFSGFYARTLTHIVCSDLVYFPELFAPLLRSLIQLTSSMFVHGQTQTTVIMFHKVRSLVKEAPFWSAFGLWFDFTPILVKIQGQEVEDWRRFDEDADDILLAFSAHRRAESFEWGVPTSDQALMAGLGAWNNDRVKGDDFFESLLLMSSAAS